ncbi:hypothetical protein CAMGR0001_1562 [Campylobacter gracilis RM3268]|uniref:Uncharacterized protein n=1 Tax=Campylobacter gracilis RM3268 TaxID=553220 RepID=C8PK12_9BACT|nr:hypothetical protein CAMGR0001_1562 [Campylobacter gracilis RM3268]
MASKIYDSAPYIFTSLPILVPPLVSAAALNFSAPRYFLS